MNGAATDGLAIGGVMRIVYRMLGFGAGAGVGVMLIALAIEMARSNPQAMFDLVKAWGPSFVFSVVLLAMGGKWMVQQQNFQERQVAVQERLAGEQRRVSDSMGSIAKSMVMTSQKDDRRAEATDAAISFVAQQNEKIVGHLKDLSVDLAEIKQRLPK